jgi:RNA polymerase sigma-70 factor (ECF subfamily)
MILPAYWMRGGAKGYTVVSPSAPGGSIFILGMAAHPSSGVRAPASPVRADDPDDAIVERVRGGETDLFEVLIRRYNQRLYRLARAFLHGDAGVEDVMQEAYLRAFAGLPRFQGEARFSTWLTRILINCALAHIRTRSRRGEVTLDAVGEAAGGDGLPGAPGTPGSTASAEQRVEQEQFGRLIERAMEMLPAKYRVVFVMREIEGISVAETAASLGISPVNAKVRLHRAKGLLREAVRRQMPDISVYGFLGDRCDRLTVRVMSAIHGARREPVPAAAGMAVHEGGDLW